MGTRQQHPTQHIDQSARRQPCLLTLGHAMRAMGGFGRIRIRMEPRFISGDGYQTNQAQHAQNQNSLISVFSASHENGSTRGGHHKEHHP